MRLDGDELRRIWPGLGFSKEDRLTNNLNAARLAAELSRQLPVIVSVIAPTARIREQVTNICDPTWVYVKRDSLPEKEGHFYEAPEKVYTIDTDILSIEESRLLAEMYFGESCGNLISLNRF